MALGILLQIPVDLVPWIHFVVGSCRSWIFKLCSVLRPWRSWILRISDPKFSFHREIREILDLDFCYCTGILDILDPIFVCLYGEILEILNPDWVVGSCRSWILTLFCHRILQILDPDFWLRLMSALDCQKITKYDLSKVFWAFAMPFSVKINVVPFIFLQVGVS